MITESKLMTIDRAAALLSCSKPKIYKLQQAGVIEFKKIGPRANRVTRESVDRILADRSLMQVQPGRSEWHGEHQRLRAAEASAYIGISVHTLNQFRGSGDGPPYIKLAGAVVYDTRDIDAWLASKKQTRRAPKDGE